MNVNSHSWPKHLNGNLYILQGLVCEPGGKKSTSTMSIFGLANFANPSSRTYFSKHPLTPLTELWRITLTSAGKNAGWPFFYQTSLVTMERITFKLRSQIKIFCLNIDQNDFFSSCRIGLISLYMAGPVCMPVYVC